MRHGPSSSLGNPPSASQDAELGEPSRTPTTWFLVGMWIAVYVAMTYVQGGFRSEMGSLGPGVIRGQVADEFGSLTAREVASGQVWRTITATFVHLSLLHLACNLSCLIAFGRLLNSWYGGPQFVCLYLAIAALGNSLAVAGRYLLRGNLDNSCAGGSSVMFGMLALIAVVGWRSRTRFGDYVRHQMVGKLFFFGIFIGIVGRNVLDNYGHAGGAIAGAVAGFGHRALIRWFDRPIAWAIGFVISVVVIVGCIAAQWNVGRATYLQERARSLPELVAQVDRVFIRHSQVAAILEQARGPYWTDPTIPFRRDIGAALAQIDTYRDLGVPGGNRARYSRWRELAQSAADHFPSGPEIQEFRGLHKALRLQLRDELEHLPKKVPAKLRVQAVGS